MYVWFLQQLLQQERKHNEDALASRRKLHQDCAILQSQLQEYSRKFTEEIISIEDSSTMNNVLDLLARSDDRIAHLLEEVLVNCFSLKPPS